ncbi:TonB dependent receptor [Solimicrobium silvestre]|uniref:TonB dependent receptor n=2 Tax=Solimicrobium silvestre TaxID=2099400 RepID=A0A2S9H558_9BURK|nr:TonB dependent receptor [Solimicrobium silvestre]
MRKMIFLNDVSKDVIRLPAATPNRLTVLSWSVAMALAGAPVMAQELMQDLAQEREEEIAEESDVVTTIVITGIASDRNDVANPVSVLKGRKLLLRSEATLGETLSSELGITASHFGVGASRPVIRGMDGARVKVLTDGSEVQDASTISPDHAVALEPLLAQQIEVIRGPSALAYGGGVAGGAVNVLDNKIPTKIPDNNIEGTINVRANSAANETAGAVELSAGSGNMAFHVEGLKRNSGDYRVGSDWSQGSKVNDSYNKSDTGSVGMSWIGAQGYLGVAYTQQNNNYGLPGHSHSYGGCHVHGTQLHCGAHEHGYSHGHDHDHDHNHDHEHGDEHEHAAPFVKLTSKRWDLRGEYREPLAGIAKISLRGGLTDYQHREIEGDLVATTFKNQAHDLRMDIEHKPFADFRGVLGVQTSRRDFSAVGEEAYVAPTITAKHGMYLLEEYRWHDWRFEGALRQEWQRTELEVPAMTRSHHGTSASLGANWAFTPGYALGMTMTRAQRLPTAEELYADGLHLATNTYELGDADLKPETSQNIDITLRKTEGPTTFSAALFYNRINNYIYGRTLDVYKDLQLLQYTQQDASFVGMEGQVRRQFTPHLGVTLFGDVVRAQLQSAQDGNGNLPRIPSARFGTRADLSSGPWSGQLEWVRVAQQNKVANFESPTPGYSMLNLELAYSGKIHAQHYTLYAKANNLTNVLAYSNTSFIKDAAPLMGRNLTVGVRVLF